jgi:hypothetical protein
LSLHKKIIEHISGMIFVTIILIGAIFFFQIKQQSKDRFEDSKVKPYLEIPITNANDPFQRTLLKEVMNIYYPEKQSENDALVQEILALKGDQFSRSIEKNHDKSKFTFSTLMSILGMYIKFLFIYCFVMILTYYGVQTLASWRFIRRKNAEYMHIHSIRNSNKKFWNIKKIAISLLKVIGTFILFCPAYVIAYSIRTEFNTDSTPFMVFLALISNGLLIMYANKYYTFLVNESRKGYIDTARVKNCNENYSFSPEGISYKQLFHPIKNFKGHIFEHIFRNARIQYLSTLKEQASFLVTGLIIIEMALNIHGHINYEMLRQMLYKNYTAVIVIILCIFYAVKLTEICADYLIHRESLKYDNQK